MDDPISNDSDFVINLISMNLLVLLQIVTTWMEEWYDFVINFRWEIHLK